MTEIPKDQYDRLKHMIADLVRLQDGYVPTDADLAGAPVLEGWMWVEVRGHPCLAGVVMGHPKIVDGHRCVTSTVMAIANDERWVRTVSRFYRLGRPLSSHVGGLNG